MITEGESVQSSKLFTTLTTTHDNADDAFLLCLSDAQQTYNYIFFSNRLFLFVPL